MKTTRVYSTHQREDVRLFVPKHFDNLQTIGLIINKIDLDYTKNTSELLKYGGQKYLKIHSHKYLRWPYWHSDAHMNMYIKEPDALPFHNRRIARAV